jgi:hypothetical protein
MKWARKLTPFIWHTRALLNLLQSAISNSALKYHTRSTASCLAGLWQRLCNANITAACHKSEAATAFKTHHSAAFSRHCSAYMEAKPAKLPQYLILIIRRTTAALHKVCNPDIRQN